MFCRSVCRASSCLVIRRCFEPCMAWVFSLVLFPVAAQLYEEPGSAFPTPTVESNCFQDNLADNQVYYQKLDQMFNGSSDAICPKTLGLFVNKPCTWAAGKATMTVAPVINQCHWAIRNFHWHDSSDEWSYMVQGVMQVILTSPTGVPWHSAVNTIGPGGVAANTGTFFTRVDPAKFTWLPEENAEPAAVNRSDVEVEDTTPGVGQGIQVFNIRTAQFPFATRMSQQRIVFQPGGFRNLVWITNAAATMTVISGHVNAATQGGISGGFDQGPSSKSYVAKSLGPYDAFYFPIRRGYWIEEATGTEPAEVIVVFEVGNWKALEAKTGFGCSNPVGAPWAYEATAGGIECPSSPELIQRRNLRRHEPDAQSFMQQPSENPEL
ncbi:unnamed protein product [Effrenium voratum]|nr:unnamed protein product [Effrenium voratum]